ncbi:DUF6943 family protein [Parachryseolinea silvisoli]|uniref:DUF6943 family protein n=1 Tax=Parachryseolinea silvisoli TaxID=2873601 RepID=UPI0022659DBF|nr:hypothetical protein [Parachryseolinea silvisoli]MCD9015238.1 hypothetical protein [Parachryseolinea silvisoli]
MQLPTVKTYTPKVKKEGYQFYVLSKGYNAGRPAHKPNVNSFVVSCQSQAHCDHFYSLCYALWKGKYFHPHLCGSVVQFIRIREFKRVVQLAMDNLNGKEDSLPAVVAALKKIEHTELVIHQQLATIAQMKKLLVSRMLAGSHQNTPSQ